MILLHGTTRTRAEDLVKNGPNPHFREAGTLRLKLDDGFSLSVPAGPHPLGTPEMYATGKSRNFPNEGGAVILAVDVPGDIIDLAVASYLPLSGGFVQFNKGCGIEELQAAWHTLPKEIQAL